MALKLTKSLSLCLCPQDSAGGSSELSFQPVPTVPRANTKDVCW